jgi:hypothetical protein
MALVRFAKWLQVSQRSTLACLSIGTHELASFQLARANTSWLAVPDTEGGALYFVLLLRFSAEANYIRFRDPFTPELNSALSRSAMGVIQCPGCHRSDCSPQWEPEVHPTRGVGKLTEEKSLVTMSEFHTGL